MKKIQVIFAALAIMIASVGVFANKRSTTVYYRHFVPWASTLNGGCSVVITSDFGCDGHTGGLCFESFPDPNDPDNYDDYFLFKRVDGGDCERLWRW